MSLIKKIIVLTLFIGFKMLLLLETTVSIACEKTLYNMCAEYVPFEEDQINCEAAGAYMYVLLYCQKHFPNASTENDCCVQNNVYCCGPYLFVRNQGVEGPVDDGGDGSPEPTEA